MTLITLIRNGARIGNNTSVWGARFEGDPQIPDGEIIPTPFGPSVDAVEVARRIRSCNPGAVVVAEIDD